MSGEGGRAERFDFGGLRFDAASGDLTGPRGVVRIAPQPAELLAFLASRPGEVVTREEIKERLWPGGRVEFAQGIAFAVREVRKAIDGAGGDSTLLQTIPKRGFRLDTAHATGPTARSEPRFVWQRWAFGYGSVALSIVVLVLALLGWPGGPPVLAIFPHDSGAERRDAELARSLGVQLTTAVTERYRGRLGVVGPTGTASVEGPADTDEARRVLGACLVLSGSLLRAGADSVIVFTQIVRTSDRVHVWVKQDTVALAGAVAAVTPAIVAGVGRSLGDC